MGAFRFWRNIARLLSQQQGFASHARVAHCTGLRPPERERGRRRQHVHFAQQTHQIAASVGESATLTFSALQLPDAAPDALDCKSDQHTKLFPDWILNEVPDTLKCKSSQHTRNLFPDFEFPYLQRLHRQLSCQHCVVHR
ncbi:uncharacterized protein LOC126249348 [Schistocerca nitens]|uniref:uncharacterized protein LOC126249348 n=1 Tax=Schistocerca nitens TaxID=7011 RepID=UPI0021196E52|nr:uncharacterized protein LOC126249348 [Schistocerca nitens]